MDAELRGHFVREWPVCSKLSLVQRNSIIPYLLKAIDG